MSFPRLHVVSPGGIAADPQFTARCAALQAACGPDLAIHLRDPQASGAQLYGLAVVLLRGAARHGGWCVINERVDVALASGADAVQLGRRALPVRAVRACVGARLVIGASVHDAAEASAAVAAGANYLLVGTIFQSATHSGAQPAGLGLLEACRDLPVPRVAIGGIDAQRAALACKAGADAVAVMRAVWASEDPVVGALQLLAAMRVREDAVIEG